MTKPWLTFEITTATGSGTIVVPTPRVWYRRWLLRLAAWLWATFSEVDPR